MIDREQLMRLLDERVDQHQSGDVGDLADEIVKLADSCSRNVPQGLYRNSQGIELNVMGYVADLTGVNIGIRTLGGDIAYAEWYDDLFKTTTPAIVTEDSLRNCGYMLVEPAEDES